MEIDPRYTQFPESLNDIYVSTSGGSPSGTQKSNAPAGTVVAAGHPVTSSAPAAATAAVNANNNAARNAATNELANSGRGGTSSGAAVSTAMEKMIPLAAIAHYNFGNAPLSVSHQGLFVASTITFNLRPGGG
jgi:multidrug efflux pump